MRLAKDGLLWVAERRGVAVFERAGKAGGRGRISTREFDDEHAAESYLLEQRDRRLAEGFECVDPDAGISDPFTVAGERKTPRALPKRYSQLGTAVRRMVRAGYTEWTHMPSAIRELIAVEGAPAKLESALQRVATEERTALLARTPPTPQINAGIDAAFGELDGSGIVALQNAGFTKSDGWEDASEVARMRGERFRGACFFSSQDVMRAMEGRGLHLSFGAFRWVSDEDAERDAETAAIGRTIVDVLSKHGVPTEWSGRIEDRISIPPFDWFRVER